MISDNTHAPTLDECDAFHLSGKQAYNSGQISTREYAENLLATARLLTQWADQFSGLACNPTATHQAA